MRTNHFLSAFTPLVASVLGFAATTPAVAAERNHDTGNPDAVVQSTEISVPVMFAIQRNYGGIEERTARIPAETLAGGDVAVTPVRWGFRYGYGPSWYGGYYGPRYYGYYGYSAPYYSYYRPGYGYGYYNYGPGYPYGGYRAYRPPYVRGYYW